MSLILLFLFLTPLVFSQRAPDKFSVSFQTTVINGTSTGVIKMLVERSWSPLGVDHFYTLLKLAPPYYNNNGFFRVVPNFVVQFGISGDPTTAAKWRNANIKDDPVTHSNVRGTVSYATAGPDTRTTQLFINYADNSYLDSQGFTPFAKIDDESMKIADAIFSGYGQLPDQGEIYSKGNAYLKAQFPHLDYITVATIENEEYF